jgi:hypothetical protein
MFLTALLMLAILFLAAEKHKATFLAPVGIGLALFMAEMTGVYYTGGSLNPVRLALVGSARPRVGQLTLTLLYSLLQGPVLWSRRHLGLLPGLPLDLLAWSRDGRRSCLRAVQAAEASRGKSPWPIDRTIVRNRRLMSSLSPRTVRRRRSGPGRWRCRGRDAIGRGRRAPRPENPRGRAAHSSPSCSSVV